MTEYIERDKAKEEILSWAVVINRPQNLSTEDTLCVLDSIPAANVAPVRHGRWEQCFEDWRKQIEGNKCSLCGFEHYGTSIRDYLYCPNCGAKLDLDDDRNAQG